MVKFAVEIIMERFIMYNLILYKKIILSQLNNYSY